MLTRTIFTVFAAAMVMSFGSTAAAKMANAPQAAIPDACKSHVLLAAMPLVQEIAGKAPLSMACTNFSIDMVWGENGDSIRIQLVDARGTLGDTPPRLAEMARDMPLRAAQTALSAADEVRKVVLSEPALLDQYGGPDFLPVVDIGPTGLHYTIDIDRQGDGGSARGLIGHVQNRYAVKIDMDETKAIGAAAGRAAYAPWLNALRLTQLP